MSWRSLCKNLGGCFIDLMAGEKRINVLEVRSWNEDIEAESQPRRPFASPPCWRGTSPGVLLFLPQKLLPPRLDTIEIMLSKMSRVKKWGISEETDFRQLKPEDYPILSTCMRSSMTNW